MYFIERTRRLRMRAAHPIVSNKRSENVEKIEKRKKKKRTEILPTMS